MSDELAGFDVIDVVGGDNNRPRLRVQLVDGTTKIPVNCLDPLYTCKVRLREPGDEDASLWEATCTRENEGYDGLWYFDPPDLDFDPGRYELQVTLYYDTDVRIQSAWNKVKIKVRERFPPAV